MHFGILKEVGVGVAIGIGLWSFTEQIQGEAETGTPDVPKERVYSAFRKGVHVVGYAAAGVVMASSISYALSDSKEWVGNKGSVNIFRNVFATVIGGAAGGAFGFLRNFVHLDR